MDVLERVGSSRMMLEGKFPYPDAIRCMRYAIQEMAEYDDVRMREDNPDHKRNNERTGDARKELGQAGYMILSAILQVEGCTANFVSEFGDKTRAYGAIVREVGDALSELFPNSIYVVNDLDWALAYWKELVTLHGWDVDDLITETCEAFERKHLHPYAPDAVNGGKML